MSNHHQPFEILASSFLVRGFRKHISNLPDAEVIHEKQAPVLKDANKHNRKKFRIAIPQIQRVRIFMKTMVDLQLGERNQRFEPTNEDSDDTFRANHKPLVLYDIACSYHVNVIKQLRGDLGSSYTPSLIG